ncbi:MAG: RNA methyltransferase [Syntrophales bacterium]|nr:RNA methyltransferase [Syntrophales bacterium]MDD5532419.1 RNA methyltransferase [Syntrophales bacterium]
MKERENQQAVKHRARMENIAVVLHNPKYAGNIGAAARSAKNMGVRDLIVVCPEPPDMEDVRRMATHLAADVVERIRYCGSLEEALSGFQFIAGTTSRAGGMRGPLIGPRELAGRLVDLSANNRIALLFGPEDIGLTNEELRLCHAFVSVPTAKEFKSINLSHAVMILCYEVFTASAAVTEGFTPRLADSSELEGMYRQLREMFVRIDYIRPENPEYWMSHVRRFFSRLMLYSKEVQIIRGICRQIDWYTSNKKA